VTAAELADELEISVATARRDLEALSAAGVPVYPQPGRGGGWSLVGGARTDLTGLTASEAQALFLLAGPAASVAPEVKSALRKLVQALPGTFRADAQAAASAVMVDAARWGEPGRPRPRIVETLQEAVVQRRKVRFWYKQRERRVSPLGLVDKDGIWYLLAGTPDGLMNHTVSGTDWRRVTFNGVEVGETGINAALCGTWGCPVLLVTGDQAACREGTALLGDGLQTVQVKTALGRFSARHKTPAVARELIEAGAKRALADLSAVKPYDPGHPCEIRVELATSDHAEQYRHRPEVEIVEGRTIVSRADDWWTAWRQFFFSHVWAE